jgi:hypothetical protein
LACADDLTLLTPAADAMIKMLMMCNERAAEFNIAFYAKKSKIMSFELRPNSHSVDLNS